jgi:cytochrome c oxidase assembly protein subunit 15
LVKQKFLSRIALAASFFALGVIALGAYTRLVDAGLGCPDWPGCYGHFTVPLSALAQRLIQLQYPAAHLVAYKAAAEMVHRYFVGGLSMLIVVLISVIFANKTFRTTWNVSLALGLVLLLGYQIMLGQWTVTLQLLPIIVSQHLIGGFLIFALLWLLYLNSSYRHTGKNLAPRDKNFLLPWAVIAFVVVLLQIALGAWVSTNYASLSCPDFPFCEHGKTVVMQFASAFNIFSPPGINYEGGVLPEAARQTIQMTHRFGALVVTGYLLIFMLVTVPRLMRFPDLMQSLYQILALLCVQLCIGISNIIFKLPLVTALSHNLVAVLLLASVLTFIFKLTHSHSGGRA